MIFATPVGNATLALLTVNRVEAEAEVRQQTEAQHGSSKGCARLNVASISSTAGHRTALIKPARRFLARSGNAQPFRRQALQRGKMACLGRRSEKDIIGSFGGRRLTATRRKTPGFNDSINDIANSVPGIDSAPPTHE